VDSLSSKNNAMKKLAKNMKKEKHHLAQAK